MLFAQLQPNNNPKPDQAEVMLLVAAVGAILVVFLAVTVMFLLTLSKALSRCGPRARTMEPGQVWLNFVPCYNIVWQFITVNRVSESLKNEFYDRGLDDAGDFGRGFGIAYCALGIAGSVPAIGPVFSLVALGCGVTYWVKIAGYSRQLAEDDRREAGRDDDRDDDRGDGGVIFDDERRRPDDDDDRRPRRRRPRYDDEDDDRDDRRRR